MRRRDLLAGLAAATVASPTWVGRAFAADPTERQLELFASWHAARRRGIPLLAVVIPDEDRWARGASVGDMLCRASDRLLAALSGYRPACATRTGLHVLGAEVPPDAWYAIVATDAVPAAVRAITGPGTEDAAVHLERALGAGRADPAAVEAGRRAWVTERIPGSLWAESSGCGTFYEGGGSDGINCGLGSMPEQAGRFLAFVDP